VRKSCYIFSLNPLCSRASRPGKICKQAFAINSDYGESREREFATVLIIMGNRQTNIVIMMLKFRHWCFFPTVELVFIFPTVERKVL
jgi:hypothetical protein